LTGSHWYSLEELLLEGNFSTLTFFVAWETRSEEKTPINGEPTFGISLTTMLHHTGLF